MDVFIYAYTCIGSPADTAPKTFEVELVRPIVQYTACRAVWKNQNSKFKFTLKQITYHVTFLISEQFLESWLDRFSLVRYKQTSESWKFSTHNQIWNHVTPINKFCFMHFVVKSFLFYKTLIFSGRLNEKEPV